jgi:hypothetical protein
MSDKEGYGIPGLALLTIVTLLLLIYLRLRAIDATLHGDHEGHNHPTQVPHGR